MLSPRPWNTETIAHLLMGILFCLCAAVLAEGIVQHFAGKDKMAEGTLLYLVAGSMIHFSILMVTVVILRLHRIRLRDVFGFANRPLVRSISLGVLVCALFIPVGMMLQEFSFRMLERLHVPTPPQEAVAQLQQAESMAARAYFVFFAVVVAPLAEEFLFRGILFAGVQQFGFPRLAMWGSAVVFAVMHMNLTVLLPLFVFGMALAWLYDKTDNLLATITAHALFNSINILELLYWDKLQHFFERFFPHLK